MLTSHSERNSTPFFSKGTTAKATVHPPEGREPRTQL
jgi:hypothetical protein